MKKLFVILMLYLPTPVFALSYAWTDADEAGWIIGATILAFVLIFTIMELRSDEKQRMEQAEVVEKDETLILDEHERNILQQKIGMLDQLDREQ